MCRTPAAAGSAPRVREHGQRPQLGGPEIRFLPDERRRERPKARPRASHWLQLITMVAASRGCSGSGCLFALQEDGRGY